MADRGLPAARPGECRLYLVALNEQDERQLQQEDALIRAALGCVAVRHLSVQEAADDARSARAAGATAVMLVGGQLEQAEIGVLVRACGAGRGQSPLVALVEGGVEEQGPRWLEAGGCDVLSSAGWRTDELVRALRLAFQISARQRVESRLQGLIEAGVGREEWLESARRYVGAGRILISASHDLANLLQPVLGHAELLVTLHPAETVSGRYARLIERSAGLAATLVRRLLMLGRTGEIVQARVDADRTIELLDGLLCLVLGPKIRFETYLGAPGVSVRLPSGALEQIALNLIANARDAMPTGGRVTLRTRHDGAGWRLEVEDTGIGIEASRIDAAFDSGYTTKSQPRGSGLGLWIVRSLAEEAGGKVWIESSPGRGTRVGVELPSVEIGGPLPAA